jgi:hypothetical protein
VARPYESQEEDIVNAGQWGLLRAPTGPLFAKGERRSARTLPYVTEAAKLFKQAFQRPADIVFGIFLRAYLRLHDGVNDEWGIRAILILPFLKH